MTDEAILEQLKEMNDRLKQINSDLRDLIVLMPIAAMQLEEYRNAHGRSATKLWDLKLDHFPNFPD